jgi:WD40 repeat protein
MGPAAADELIPFKGLSPYAEDDARFFFGREKAQRIIRANLLAYPLTVLYGATGVGKSSVLRAGVLHQLHQEALDNLAQLGQPELVVVVVSNWRDEPLITTRQSVRQALADLYPAALHPDDPPGLRDALKVWAERVAGPILVVLDQFEEYFLYRADEQGPDTFAEQFPQIVNDVDVLANFLVAIREDALAWLDRFKRQLPNLLDNYIRIRHLDKESARKAIVGPVDAWNRLRPEEERVTLEPGLDDALLDDLKFGQVALGARGQGLAGRESTIDALQGAVETPYLQLVMRRLWDTEQAKGSHRLRLVTLQEDLGGAAHIVRTHLDDSMGSLDPAEQGIAAGAFQYLVTPSGTKFAHLLPDLSGFTGASEEALAPVMAKLAATRILRQVPAPGRQDNVLCFEIFHDVLAPAILDWRTRYVEAAERAKAQEELERQLKEQQAESDRLRAQRRREEQQRRLALSNELAAIANQQLSVDPELSVLLAIQAVEQSATPLARDALRQSLLESRIRRVLRGHTGEVSRASFSPDGRWVVTASQDTSARVWEVDTGEELAVLRGHDDWVWRASFSPDGRRVVTASKDGTARLWSAGDGRELAVLAHEADEGKGVWTAAFSGDGTRIVTAGDDGTARLWDGRTGVPVRVLAGHRSGVRDAAFTPDGRRVITGGIDGETRLWDVGTGSSGVLQGHGALIWGISVSPDGRLAASASQDRTARVWELATGRLVAILEGHTDEVWSAEFSPDSRWLVTASFDRTARIWDIAAGRTQIELRGHTHSVYSACFSPDGRWVLTGSLDGTARVQEVDTGRTVSALRGHTRGVNFACFSSDGMRVVTTSQDGTARYWDSSAGQSSRELRGHSRAVTNVAFSPDSRRLATAGGDKRVGLWDVSAGRLVRLLGGHDREVSGAVFSPDDRRIATGSWDATGAVRDAGTGEILALLKGHHREITAIAFSPDGARVVTASRDRTARVWEADTGRQLFILAGHEAAIKSVAYSPDGRLVATASNDTTAKVWDAATGRLRAELVGHQEPLWTIAFSPDGTSVITASEDRTARIWDVANAKVITELRGHTGKVYGAAFHPEGNQVITSSEDRTAYVWDTDTGRPLMELRGHAGAVNAAAFSPDGQLVATGGDDGAARVYRITVRASVEDLLVRARERVTRELTPEERVKYLREGTEAADVAQAPEIISL